MASQQSFDDFEALESLRKSILRKNDVILHLQQEVEAWKIKYYRNKEEVQCLTQQLNDYANFSQTAGDAKVQAFVSENPTTYAVEIKEEVREDDDWLHGETEPGLVGRCNQQMGGDSEELTTPIRQSCFQVDADMPGQTADSLFSQSCCEEPEASESTNAAVGPSLGQPSQQTATETTTFSENPSPCEVEIKEEVPEDDDWLQGETESGLVGKCNQGMGGDSEELTTPIRQARVQVDASMPEQTADSLFSQSCSEEPEASGSNNASVGPSLGQPSQQTGDETTVDCSSSMYARVRPKKKYLQVRGPQRQTCHICRKNFLTPSHLETHMRYHTGEEPFERFEEACGYRSSALFKLYRDGVRRGSREGESRRHDAENLLACSVEGCDYRAGHLAQMEAHARCHAGYKPFACPEEGCGYRSANLSNYRRHVRNHAGEKPLSCPVEGCGYRTAVRSNMARHARSHTGERPYACPVEGCGYRAAQLTQLQTHSHSHTGLKPFVCPVEGCGLGYATSGNRNQHVRDHHADIA